MVISTEDDLLSSLGGSLMRDLLSDITDGSNLSTKDDKTLLQTDNTLADEQMCQKLLNLERELDRATNISNDSPAAVGTAGTSATTTSTTSASLPRAPPGFSTAPLTAGSLIVGSTSGSHTNTKSINGATLKSTSGTETVPSNGNDAWSEALSKFSAMQLTEDFLQAEVTRKEHLEQTAKMEAEGEKMTNDLVDSLFEEDYDVDEKATIGIVAKDISAPTPPTATTNPVSTSAPSIGSDAEITNKAPLTPPRLPPGMIQQATKSPMMAPPPTIPPNMTSPLPPHMPSPNAMPPPPHPMQMQMPLPPHMRQLPPHLPPGPLGPPGVMSPGFLPPGFIPPPGPHGPHGPPPPGAGMPMMRHPPHHPSSLPPQQRSPMPMPMPMHPNAIMNRNTGVVINPMTPGRDTEELPSFTQKDFPKLGTDEEVAYEESKKDEGKVKETTTKTTPNNSIQKKKKPVKPRIHFTDPSPTRPPILTSSIPTKSMSTRDLNTVIFSMMRPLLTFASVLDAYNADYYRWSFDDRKSRNLLFLGGAMNAAGGGGNGNDGKTVPNPVWKETKTKAKEMEEKFQESVEKRASDWSKEKNILGKVVKVNVKRPRALLSTTALTAALRKDDQDGKSEEKEYDDRAILWAARLAIDKGYLAYLNLVELRRLLQSRPGDTFMLEDEEKRGELLEDVKDNVNRLHGAFGVKILDENDGNNNQTTTEVNFKILSRTLSLPKGRVLLSRVIDEGILPHSSACHILPVVVRAVYESSIAMELSTSVLQPGEDRLLRSLTGLVRTIQPSVDAKNLLACLTSMTTPSKKNDDNSDTKQQSVKEILSLKRTLMELLHAVLSRAADVCAAEGMESDWKAKEAEFLLALSC